MKSLKILSKYLLNLKYTLIFFILFMLISSIIGVILPILTGEYVNILTDSANFNQIYKFCIIILIIFICNIVFKFILNMLTIKLRTKITFLFNRDILEHVKRLPLSYFEGKDIFYLNQRINNDVGVIINFIFKYFFNVFISIFSVSLYFFFLLKINLSITFIILILALFSYILYKIFRSYIYTSTYNYREAQSIFSSKMIYQVKDLKYSKINSLYEDLLSKLNISFDNLYDKTIKYGFISYLYIFLDGLIANIGIFLLYLIGGFLVIDHKISIGTIIISTAYFSQILNCISTVLDYGKISKESDVSYNRIVEILNVKEDAVGTKIINKIYNLNISNVDIFYGKDIILKNINYKFSKGNIYILKGENGTGKSSLINAIIGIRKNYKGKILLNNINVENLNMYYLRKNTIKVVEQEPFILEETIENILKSNSYSEMFFNTLNFLNLNELVKKIKTTNNIQNVILNLSGGQKQKLSISIALANSPSLLVLDEPTSALDTDSVSKLKELLANNIKNKIIIIICHNDKFDDISTEIIHLDYYKNKDNEDQKM